MSLSSADRDFVNFHSFSGVSPKLARGRVQMISEDFNGFKDKGVSVWGT
jgi:hypothetical protein